jgi:hypothetical protein
MDITLKKKWTDALRSGEYEQGQARFFNPDSGKYCCLGVLCVVAGQLPFNSSYQENTVGNWRFAYDTIGHGWMDDKHMETVSYLAHMNDHACSFPEIADWIEKNL